MEEILRYLLATYAPKAILLHGSRTGADAGAHSDYDLILLTKDYAKICPHVYNGSHLDLDGADPDRDWTIQPYEHLWPLQILHDDADGKGQTFYDNMQRLHNNGPPHLSPEAWENRKNYLARLLNRLDARGSDLLIRQSYLSLFYDRALRYWFEKRGDWTRPVYQAIPHIKAQDAAFASHLYQLWSDSYMDGARALYADLFEN